MSSETSTWYASRVRRQGRSRALALNQARRRRLNLMRTRESTSMLTGRPAARLPTREFAFIRVIRVPIVPSVQGDRAEFGWNTKGRGLRERARRRPEKVRRRSWATKVRCPRRVSCPRHGSGRTFEGRVSPQALSFDQPMSTTLSDAPSAAPISLGDVQAARERIAPYLAPTPLREYSRLAEAAGGRIELFVKHENHQPTGSFKIRNGLSFMTSLDAGERRRGVVAASTGNHGQGIAYGARLLGVSATVCVPAGNNPDKNAAMRALGATVVEEGRDYDESVAIMQRLAEREGRVVAHSTNDPRIIAGAGTMTLEILEQQPALDAIVIAIGGGSQAVGAITVARALAPTLEVYGVQAAGASAIHDSWHAGERLTRPRAATFADGVATRTTYDLTFPALRAGLAGFVTVTDAEIAESLRTILSVTHSLVEGAGAMGFAALPKLGGQLAGKRVAVVFCGGNIDTAVLKRVLNGEL